MLPNIHAPEDWPALRRAGRTAAATLAHVTAKLRPGVSTAQIDAWVREHTAAVGGRPSQLGYQGFPAAVCTSVGDVVCHGVPREDVVLAEGDIVNVDVTTEIGGWHGDTSRTVLIGAVSPRLQRLVQTTRDALHAGIAAAQPGGHLGDVGAAVQAVAEEAGYRIVEDFGGHGIGRRMHLPPHVRHTGRRGTGPRLVPGFTFTIEPMLVEGSPDVTIDAADGWTVRTLDGGPSAQFEHTILITEDGPEILTL